MATRSEHELEKSLSRVQQYGSWRRELTDWGLLPGEPRAAFNEHDAAQAADSHAVTVLPPGKPPRKRHVKVGVRPSRKERGLK
jgi:hypothetical protein